MPLGHLTGPLIFLLGHPVQKIARHLSHFMNIINDVLLRFVIIWYSVGHNCENDRHCTSGHSDLNY